MHGNSSTISQTLYAHTEQTTIGGVNYYLHKLSSADGPATSLSVSAASTGRKLVGRWVYPLNGIVSIPASTWAVTYRAKTSSSASSVVAHSDVDILIRKSDNTIRTTIATNVANSPSLTLVNTWQTLTGTYSWTAYTVVDQTDYLEVAYYIEVTTAQNSKSVYLRVDDNTLALADQTKIENIMFSYPNQAPVASFTYSPPNPLILETVTFNASASYDPDGTIVGYQWNFGDGNITTVADAVITHVYPTANSTVNYPVTLTVIDTEGATGFTTQSVPVTNPSILHVSLPAGTYGGNDPDPWLNEGWLLNVNSGSGTFSLRINDTSASHTSYDTHLIIALNNAAYNNLVSLSVDGNSILKSSFQFGSPKPYNVWDWPSGDVYPTWFSDTYVFATINPKSYKDLTVSVAFLDATGARMHFDAYGSVTTTPPTNSGKITHNPISEDSTVLFWPTVNTPPVAYDQSVTTPEDTPKAITLTASDVDGDPLTYEIVAGPSHGSLSGIPPDVTYTPDPDYTGSDSFTFRAFDGQAYSNIATVTITVTRVNDAPVAVNDAYSTNEDTTLSVSAPGVLGNDYDVDGDALTVVLVSGAAHGTVTLNADGSFTYTPNPNWNGVDSFTYKANDGQAYSNVATVTITVNPVNDPPVAYPQSVTTPEDTPKAITLTASDPEGDPLTYSVVTPPSHGTLSGTAPNLIYTPDPDYSGPDSFTFKAYDGQLDSNIATVSITVNPVNDPPVAYDQSVTTPEDTPKAITLTASDPEGDPLTYSIVTGPAHGTLSGTPPNVIYTPNPNWNGVDSFTYKANDGSLDSNIATVTITVTAQLQVPVGGSSVALTKQTPTSSLIVAYAMLIALFSASLSLFRRKRKW